MLIGCRKPDHETETFTLKVLAVEVLPAASLAVQLTVVLPIGKVAPGAGVQVTVGFGGSTASVAVGLV